ncbi:unnamed protein product [Arctogadus glacialis]
MLLGCVLTAPGLGMGGGLGGRGGVLGRGKGLGRGGGWNTSYPNRNTSYHNRNTSYPESASYTNRNTSYPNRNTSSPRYFIDRHTDLERQFNINVDDGKITLAKALDRETDMWHNITVTATEVRNHSQISRAVVAIRVMDVNDNAPEFATEYEAFLCENGKPGQVIQTISAVDRDDPIQGHYFDYRLVPEMLNNPNFTIKNNQGVLAVLEMKCGGTVLNEKDPNDFPPFFYCSVMADFLRALLPRQMAPNIFAKYSDCVFADVLYPHSPLPIPETY